MQSKAFLDRFLSSRFVEKAAAQEKPSISYIIISCQLSNIAFLSHINICSNSELGLPVFPGLRFSDIQDRFTFISKLYGVQSSFMVIAT